MNVGNASPSWDIWLNFPLRTENRFFDILLLAIPATAVLRYFTRPNPLWLFVIAATATVPLVAALGIATEELSIRTGPRIGGLLNATLGNSTQLILGVFMLRSGQSEVVKASLSGSIVGNICSSGE